jgi:hypothetical protein
MSFGELLIAPQVWPFSLALLVFGVIVALEVIMAVVGFGAEFGLDVSLDLDLPDPHVYSKFLDWLGVGRVPYLISIAAFLLSFGFIGLFAQAAQLQFVSAVLPWPLVAAGAVALSLPLVRMLNLGLGKLWPKDVESTAVSRDSLIGHEARVVLGRITAESPGQIKVRDEHGTWHYGLAVADTAEAAFEPGDRLLIVARRGSTFAVIRHPNPADDGKP